MSRRGPKLEQSKVETSPFGRNMIIYDGNTNKASALTCLSRMFNVFSAGSQYQYENGEYNGRYIDLEP